MLRIFRVKYLLLAVFVLFSVLLSLGDASAASEQWTYDGTGIRGDFSAPEKWEAKPDPQGRHLLDYPRVNNFGKPGDPMLPVEVYDITLTSFNVVACILLFILINSCSFN